MVLVTLDYAIAAISVLASFFSLVFFWTVKRISPFLKKVCLTSEGILEVCLLALLGLAISTFGNDTASLRKRLKFTVGFLYATGLFSTLTYGVLIAVRLSDRVGKERLQKWKGRVGQFAWFMFLVSSLAAFVAYLTVRTETDDQKDNGSGIDIWALIAPSIVALGVFLSHIIFSIFTCFNLFGRGNIPRKSSSGAASHPSRPAKWFSWTDTSAYHDLFLRLLLTMVSIVLLVLPIFNIISNGELLSDDNNDAFGAQNLSIALVDIIAAGMHRIGLAKWNEQRSSAKQTPAPLKGAAPAPAPVTAPAPVSAPAPAPVAAPAPAAVPQPRYVPQWQQRPPAPQQYVAPPAQHLPQHGIHPAAPQQRPAPHPQRRPIAVPQQQKRPHSPVHAHLRPGNVPVGNPPLYHAQPAPPGVHNATGGQARPGPPPGEYAYPVHMRQQHPGGPGWSPPPPPNTDQYFPGPRESQRVLNCRGSAPIAKDWQ